MLISRTKAAIIHLAISLLVALTVAGAVFLLWYPKPYHHLSGGTNLFLMIIGIDLTIGPALTLVIFNRAKPASELRRDILIIVVLQIVALIYGSSVAFQARPTHLVFEYNRFRVVHAGAEVPEGILEKATRAIDMNPLVGPMYVGLKPIDPKDRTSILMQELSGYPVANRADMWVPYEGVKDQVIKAARPLSDLESKLSADEIEKIYEFQRALDENSDNLTYLPVISRFGMAAAILRKGSEKVLGIIEVRWS